MKLFPFLFSIIIWGISYNIMYVQTNTGFANPKTYCVDNSKTYNDYDKCTKQVARNGFFIVLVPILLGLVTFIILNKSLKKRTELII